MDKNDHRQLSDEQKSAGHQLADKKAFDDCFVAKMADIRETVHEAKRPKSEPTPMPLMLPQSEVSSYRPPGSSVWRSNTRQLGWCGHLPPFKRVSATNAKYGEEEAPFELLRMLWRQYFFTQGLKPKDCPFTGLFKEAVP